MTRQESTARTARTLFAVSIIGSAFLIFLVQPLVAKRILPWFGGTPAVWMLCLAFYQTTLFAGYAYAHALMRWAPPRAQVVLHGAVLMAAVLSLPILPGSGWAPETVDAPTRHIVALLLAEVAFPFFALAATGPLIQAWYARTIPGREPYALYAVSNAGSMLALIGFPVLIEPRWSLPTIGTAWGAALVAVAVAIFGCSLFAARAGDVHPVEADDLGSLPASVRMRDSLQWLLLSGAAVVLMMGVSNRLCLDVASIPFLWILPLSIYLLTFILCFAEGRGYRRAPFLVLALMSLGVLVAIQSIATIPDLTLPALFETLYFEIALYSTLLFSNCMLLHGELYRLRPSPTHLTHFYLNVSAGGALGGLFVGLVAPQIFSDYSEMEVGFVLTLVGLLAAMRSPESGAAPDTLGDVEAESVFSIQRVLAVLAVGLIGVQLFPTFQASDSVIWQERSFFGVLKVFESGEGLARQRKLGHGSTLHGVQFTSAEVRERPTSYYGLATSLGALMAARNPSRPVRVGVVGLGVGTIAAYGRSGDTMRFYEIDPSVVEVARDSGFFSFMSDSAATIEVAVGDARLLLEREQAAGQLQDFEILVVDAFSSDSIPAHLITEEAFAVYRKALAPNGIIAVHLSNRHLDLMPTVSKVGERVGLASVQIVNERIPLYQSQTAKWVFLSAQPRLLEQLVRVFAARHARMGVEPGAFVAHLPTSQELESVETWTDDFIDLVGVLRPL